MIQICHASISENKTVNGVKGDQTGKEVCRRNWYSKPWSLMLRYPDQKIAYKMANIASMLADSELVGYSQAERNTLYNELKKHNFNASKYISSEVKTNTDCSAFLTAVAVCAGVDKLQYTGNAPTTSTMEAKFSVAGFKVYKDAMYLNTPDYLSKGDILVKPSSHTVIAVESGNKGIGSIVRYYPIYKGDSRSLVEALQAVGEKDTSMTHRKQIAELNGYKPDSYTGTANQNNNLLKKLKAGSLIREVL